MQACRPHDGRSTIDRGNVSRRTSQTRKETGRAAQPVVGRRSSVSPRGGRASSSPGGQSSLVRPAPRRWTIIAAAVLLLTLLIAAGLSWQSSRRTKSPQATAPATDPWEAGLLRAVQAHPTDAHVHEELAAYYGEHQQP